MKFLALQLVVSLTALTASAFNFNYNANTNGSAMHWSFTVPPAGIPTNSFNTNTHAIRFYIASDAFSTTNKTAELNAVRNCFGQWQSISNTVIRFEDAGLAPSGYTLNTADNSNVVFWARSSAQVGGDNISAALGVTYSVFSVPDNTVKQFDIALNAVNTSWFTDFSDTTNANSFVEGVLLHEIGHALGLAHASIGGATMLYAGQGGLNTQVGLSPDEIAFARTLYYSGNDITNYGTLKGAVTNSSLLAVFGAAVTLESTNGNLTAGTVTLTNGSFFLNAIPPGSYNVRVTPLDPTNAANRLIAGQDINGSKFVNANTNFLPTTNIPVTITAGATNTLNVKVTVGTPAFRITLIQAPAPSDAGSFDIISSPVTISPGTSNYLIGVLSDTLPTSGATFSITGDGLTLGAPNYVPQADGVNNWIYATIDVSSNATPGLRTFIVTQGTNRAYANGFLEVLPKVFDYNFDGLDDVFQRKYFFPFTSSNAAPSVDPDGDSMNNYAEYIAGTIPTNSTSLLLMQSVTVTNTGYFVQWQSVSGKRYQVWAQTNLTSGSWFTVGSPVTATNVIARFFDNTLTNTAHFYRVQALP